MTCLLKSASVLAVSLGVLLASLTLQTSTVDARASGIFDKLNGVWRGGGRIKLENGRTERIACRAYYNAKEAGALLGLAIRCASAGNKIELRASLQDTNGRLSGTWEERTFNATGDVSGTARRGRVKLLINGAVSGSVNISFSGRRQSVDISTGTEGLRGIAISLRR